MITLSLVDATVSSRSDTALCALVGLNTSSPSTIPTLVLAVGPSNGMSEIQVAIAEPSIAVISGLQSGSTLITMLFNVTSLR